MIELKSLTRRYGDFTAVDNLTLSVQKGEIFGFVGPNGAGKTTTIKMMGGVIAPTSGSVTVCGIDMASQPEAAKKKIGFIPDRPYLYEKLTGMEFLRFIADLYEMDENSFRERAEEKLKLFSLSDWGNELVESYSHGMKQRLVMASALLHEPELIIVDEPLVGLDPQGIKMVRNLFRELSGNGVTIFMSTHTLKVAEDVCDRIGIIHKGALIASGTINDLKLKAGAGVSDFEDIFLLLTR